MDFECIEHPCVREAAQHCAASRTFAKSAGIAPSYSHYHERRFNRMRAAFFTTVYG